MNKLNLAPLKNVLEDVWSKKLNHDQTLYFCGTSACIAGWIVALYSKLIPYSVSQKLKKGELDFGSTELVMLDDPWQLAQDFISLTDLEAQLLFLGGTTKAIQKVVLEKLEQGIRLIGDLSIENQDNISIHFFNIENVSEDLTDTFIKSTTNYAYLLDNEIYDKPLKQTYLVCELDYKLCEQLCTYLNIPILQIKGLDELGEKMYTVIMPESSEASHTDVLDKTPSLI